MDREDGGPTTAFVSYSHDSPSHSKRVLALSDRLRSEGIDCRIDQYEMAPPEGWPAWMDRMIRDSDYVLVVCTEVYHRRVSGMEEPGVGKGAKWEGAIIGQDLYEAEGRNEKFLPVVFDTSDLDHRPRYLRGTTYYDVSSGSGYEQLYRRLTNQPKVVPREVGEVRVLETEPPAVVSSDSAAPDNLVLLTAEKSKSFVAFEADEIRAGNVLELTLIPINAADASLLRELQKAPGGRTGVAYGSEAVMGRVQSVEQVVAKGKDSWKVTIEREAADFGAGIMEMGTSNYSADDLAEMRGRRVLLNETIEDTPFGRRGEMDQAFMEVLIRGQSSPIQVTESPFPSLWEKLKGNEQMFLAVARLVGVMWLRFSGVVEHVHRLDLALTETGDLEVKFEGQRPRKYDNVDPPVVRISGICDLD